MVRQAAQQLGRDVETVEKGEGGPSSVARPGKRAHYTRAMPLHCSGL